MNKKVTVVGLGYVGLPLAVLARLKGYDVQGIDLDKDKNQSINNGDSPIHDEFVESNLEQGYIKASDSFEIVKTSDVVLVCVPTPVHNDFQPDLGPLKGACSSIAKNIKRGTLLIIESTINPGVCDEILLPLIEKESGLEGGKDFHLTHCPERINPGDPKWTVQNIPRVVGSLSKEGLKRSVEFYESIIDANIKPMGSLKEAEAVKVVENSFRDINIAFVNELAMSFSKLGINVVNVIDGAATKPFAFMPHYPGVGVGGHCIPVDPYYLIEYAKQSGFDHDFLLLARNINKRMPEFTLGILQDALNEAGLALSKSKVTVLGISYKPDVADDRESPSYKLVELLKNKKADVKTFDPHFMDKSSANDLSDALNTDAIVLATAHSEFRDIDPVQMKKAGVKVVVDGRNRLDKDKFLKAGLIYKGVGV